MSGTVTLPDSEASSALNSEARPAGRSRSQQAMLRALALNPGDEKLKHAFQQLIRPEELQQAVNSGIFISYTRADELFALDLTLHLRRFGCNIWMDELEIPLTEDWDTEIHQAIHRCGIMLAVISPAALHDPQLQTEWRNFHLTGKFSLPLLHKPIHDPRQLSFPLPTVDFSHNFQHGLHQLARALYLAAAPAKTG